MGDTIDALAQWAIEHPDLVVSAASTFALALLGLIGKLAYRHAAVVQAAQILADSIRRNANIGGTAKQVKLSVSMADGTANFARANEAPIVGNEVAKPAVVDALQDLINAVDPVRDAKKLNQRQILVRELARGIPIIAKLARKLVLPALVLFAAVGCASLPVITTTAPDGTVTTRTDTEAIEAFVDIATQSAQTLMAFISDMEARKAEAEARGDAREAAKWDKQAALARESLAILLEAFPPVATNTKGVDKGIGEVAPNNEVASKPLGEGATP